MYVLCIFTCWLKDYAPDTNRVMSCRILPREYASICLVTYHPTEISKVHDISASFIGTTAPTDLAPLDGKYIESRNPQKSYSLYPLRNGMLVGMVEKNSWLESQPIISGFFSLRLPKKNDERLDFAIVQPASACCIPFFPRAFPMVFPNVLPEFSYCSPNPCTSRQVFIAKEFAAAYRWPVSWVEAAGEKVGSPTKNMGFLAILLVTFLGFGDSWPEINGVLVASND